MAHPPRYPLPVRVVEGPWEVEMAATGQKGASLVMGWAVASAAGWLEVRQWKGLAKFKQSVGDKKTLAGLQGWEVG